MQTTTHTTRRQLGELAAMQAQTEAMERRILTIATDKLDKLTGELQAARVAAMTDGDEAQSKYADLVHERGRLELVISRAREALRTK
jgi:hypothetical protein